MRLEIRKFGINFGVVGINFGVGNEQHTTLRSDIREIDNNSKVGNKEGAITLRFE